MTHTFSKRLLACIVLLSTLLFSGCATKRGEVALQVPEAQAQQTPLASNGKTIYINSVVDKRFFELKPADPSTPSLDPSEPQSDAIKERAVGRKRNGYGMALGDILLSEGQSVSSVVKSGLKDVFVAQGYKVLDSKADVTPQTYIVDAKITKFWSWMNMGFWALTISCEIETNVQVNKEGTPQSYTVHVKAADSFQTGMESNYLEVMQKAVQQYVNEAKTDIK